jgi:integrative and conjugative element protein (TIGR02256 family)
MRYTYDEIQGSLITDFNQLNIPRAKSIALAAINNPAYVFNATFIRRADDAEIILLTLDIEISQISLNGIEEREDIAIICHTEDEYFPEVFALRENFCLGLPHTNLMIKEHPVSLCVTEHDFQETKIRFNAFEFIESIRRWLSLTSQNKLHQEDQSLEPFFFPKGYVILPNNIEGIDYKNFGIIPIFIGSNIYRIQERKYGEAAYFGIGFDADEQVSGFIRRKPQIIRDLEDFVFVRSVNISQVIANELNRGKNFLLNNRDFQKNKLALFFEIPVKRNSTKSPEIKAQLFFLTEKTILEIGVEVGVWSVSDTDGIISSKNEFEKHNIEGLRIEAYSTINDFSRSSAAIYNNEIPCKSKFTLIGIGALGSQVLSLFARTGYGEWNIIDKDILLPHNLARHALSRDAVGYNKVEKLAGELNSLLGEKFSSPISADFIKISKDQNIISKLKESKAIIDISTSIAVGRLLARDYDNQIKARRISAFLNPSGQDLVILAEDEKRNYKLDFLEMEYYRFLFREDKLHNHLILDEGLKIRYNRNSCREISSRINQINVSMLSAICAKSIKNILENKGAHIAIWCIDSIDCTVQKYSMLPTKWTKILANEWKIYLNIQLMEDIRILRIEKLPKETGGVLLGSIDLERRIIYVYDTICAPSDSIETDTSFERGKEGIIEKYNNYRRITGNQIQYLGEWHSHPDGYSTNPSPLDEELFIYLSERLSQQGYPTLMTIIGNGDEYSLTFRLV